MSVNKVILIGHLGRDPEVRTFQSGGRAVSFSLATSESWRDKDSGERKTKTEWHNVNILNEGIGKIAEQYLRKGSKVFVEGQIQTREYTDKDGNQRKMVEIVLKPYRGELTLLDGKSDGASDDSGERRQRAAKPENTGGSGGGGLAGQIDDDIPFAPEWR